MTTNRDKKLAAIKALMNRTGKERSVGIGAGAAQKIIKILYSQEDVEVSPPFPTSPLPGESEDDTAFRRYEHRERVLLHGSYKLYLLDQSDNQEQVRKKLSAILKQANISPLFTFAANVGMYGAFVTENREVYKALVERAARGASLLTGEK